MQRPRTIPIDVLSSQFQWFKFKGDVFSPVRLIIKDTDIPNTKGPKDTLLNPTGNLKYFFRTSWCDMTCEFLWAQNFPKFYWILEAEIRPPVFDCKQGKPLFGTRKLFPECQCSSHKLVSTGDLREKAAVSESLNFLFFSTVPARQQQFHQRSKTKATKQICADFHSSPSWSIADNFIL